MVVRDRCNRTRVCVGRRHIGQLGALLLAVSLFLAADPASGQERGIVPVTVDGEQVKLATITYKSEGTGPFPVLIFHHGSTGGGTDPSVFAESFDPKPHAEWFTLRGWAVVLPSRWVEGALR